jgi:hypothetical protein
MNARPTFCDLIRALRRLPPRLQATISFAALFWSDDEINRAEQEDRFANMSDDTKPAADPLH